MQCFAGAAHRAEIIHLHEGLRFVLRGILHCPGYSGAGAADQSVNASAMPQYVFKGVMYAFVGGNIALHAMQAVGV